MYFKILLLVFVIFLFNGNLCAEVVCQTFSGGDIDAVEAAALFAENCSIVPNGMLINNSLENLELFRNIKVIQGTLEIMNNPLLTNISGFHNLERVESTLSVSNCLILSSVEFTKLEYIGGLKMENNRELESVNGFTNLKEIQGDLLIKNNNVLKNVYGFSNVTVGGTVTVQSNGGFLCEDNCNLNILYRLKEETQGGQNNFQCSLEINIGEICSQNFSAGENLCYQGTTCLTCNGCYVNISDIPIPDICGDGIINIGEECDNSTQNFNSYSCLYGLRNCTFCNSQCKIEQGNISYCGDNVTDSMFEECDNQLSPDCSECFFKIQNTTNQEINSTFSQSYTTFSTTNSGKSSTIDPTTDSKKSSFMDTTTDSTKYSTKSDSESISSTLKQGFEFCESRNCTIIYSDGEIVIIEILGNLTFYQDIIFPENYQLLVEGNLNLDPGIQISIETSLQNSLIKIDGCLDAEKGNMEIQIDESQLTDSEIDILEYGCLTSKFGKISMNDLDCYTATPVYKVNKLVLLTQSSNNVKCGSNSNLLLPLTWLINLVLLFQL